jgi:hypothetical protein
MRQSFLITGARAPVALHLARLLHGAGHVVHLADSLAHPLGAATRMKAGYHPIPSLRDDPDRAAAVLAGLIGALRIDLVIPTCEEVLHLARIWQDQPMPAPLFAPPFVHLEEAHNKFRFITLCARLGLPAPRTRLIRTPDDLAALAPEARSLVFKPVWSRFATRTLIRPDPRRLTRITPGPNDPWVAQDFVAGEELCAYAVAHAGRVTVLAAYRGLVRAGLGASVAFKPVEDPALTRFVTGFVEGTGWSGQISFDLIRRPDGTILPIECNPRATSGLHFFRDPPAFDRALRGEGTSHPDVTRSQGVRLALWLYGLPQVLRSGRWSAFRQALAEVEEVMDWPGDRIGLGGQLRPLAEIARLALSQRVSLQTASTRDLEWNGLEWNGLERKGLERNGPDQSSIS